MVAVVEVEVEEEEEEAEEQKEGEADGGEKGRTSEEETEGEEEQRRRRRVESHILSISRPGSFGGDCNRVAANVSVHIVGDDIRGGNGSRSSSSSNSSSSSSGTYAGPKRAAMSNSGGVEAAKLSSLPSARMADSSSDSEVDSTAFGALCDVLLLPMT